MKGSTLRVFVVEDHDLTRRGLIEILRDEGVEVVGEAASVAVAKSLAPRLRFDVALIDVYLKDGDGIDLVNELAETNPDVRCVILSGSEDQADLFRALRVGAAGFLSKNASIARLGDTLRAAMRGETLLSREMTSVLVAEFQRLNRVRSTRTGSVRAQLTSREWQILNLLADGRRTGEIAADLVISIETVRSHIKSVMRKLEVSTRAAAVAYLEELRDSMDTPMPVAVPVARPLALAAAAG